MFWAEVILLLVGIVLLVVGYRKNSRNMMLVAALLMWASAGLLDLVEGFTEGFSAVGDSSGG